MRQRLRIVVLALVVAVGLCAPTMAGPATAEAAEHTISGIVLGDDGLPLTGAAVKLAGSGEAATVVTGADGRWASSVPDGGYTITFSHAAGGYLTEQFDNHHDRRFFSHSSSVSVKGEDVPGVDAQLVREGSIGGRIVSGGAPVEGAIIQLEGVVAGEDLRFTQSGADGRFSFPDLVPGTFEFLFTIDSGDVNTPDRSSGLVDVSVASGEHVDLKDLRAPDDSNQGSLELTAVGGDLSNVRLMSADDPVTPAWASTGISPGRPETFTNLPAGTYKILYGWSSWQWLPNSWVGGASFFSATPFVVKAGEVTRVSARPSQPTDLYGFARSTRGQDVPDITVLLRRADRPDDVVGSAQTDASGLFRFEAVPPGDLLVTTVDPSGRYATTTVPFGPDDVRVTMPRKDGPELTSIRDLRFTARARYVGADGARPVDGLQLYRADDASVRADVDRSSTTGEGDQTIAPPGVYKVRLGAAHWYGGRSFASATPVTLTAGTITDIDVGSLPTNGDLVGTARGVDGVLLKDAAAMVYAADNPNELIALGHVQGRFRVEGLPVRPYKIRIDDPTGRYASAWVGGGDSFASAPSFTPEISEETNVGVATLPRWTGPAPWDVRPVTAPVAEPARPLAPAPLVARDRPRITGTPKVGRTLRTSTPRFNRRAAAYTRTWFRDGRRIGGATRTTYRLKKKDAGHRITVRWRARSADGQSVLVTSRPTRRVSRS